MTKNTRKIIIQMTRNTRKKPTQVKRNTRKIIIQMTRHMCEIIMINSTFYCLNYFLPSWILSLEKVHVGSCLYSRSESVVKSATSSITLTTWLLFSVRKNSSFLSIPVSHSFQNKRNGDLKNTYKCYFLLRVHPFFSEMRAIT